MAIGRLPAGAVRERLRQVSTVDDIDQLAALQIPMLYLQAKRDIVVGRTAFEQMAAAAPSIELASVAGPHFLLGAKPDECAAVIKGFADRLSFDHSSAASDSS